MIVSKSFFGTACLTIFNNSCDLILLGIKNIIYNVNFYINLTIIKNEWQLNNLNFNHINHILITTK